MAHWLSFFVLWSPSFFFVLGGGQDDAIASGHAAYRMEENEEEPNLFTVNVGNLPPGKEVEVVITYVTEFEFEEGQLKFRIPSNNQNPSYTAAGNSPPQLKLQVHFSTHMG